MARGRRRHDPDGPRGLLLVDKPAGMTSHDVVAWARRALGCRRVGHAGTLDPLASGLLPVLVGPATRLVPYLHDWPKTYVGVVLLGRETETGDLEDFGDAPFSPAPLPPRDVLDRARERLSGTHLQVPPAYSAKKIGGTPAHKLARHGAAPVLDAVPVTVHRLRLVRAGHGRIAFAARVSSGTYLRALARDLGRLLGTGACLASLRRTAIGPLSVREAIRPSRDPSRDEVLSALRPPEAVPLPLPTVSVSGDALAWFRGGRPVVPDVAPEAPAGAICRVLGPSGLEGLGAWDGAALLQPRVVLNAPEAAVNAIEGAGAPVAGPGSED